MPEQPPQWKKNTQKNNILSWSTTWHILKNAVCFEHSKCTHIDRCSRLLSPSPANREAHTRVVIIGLEEWDKNSPFLLLFFFFFSLRTISYFAFFPPFSFPVQRAQRQKNGGEKTEGENDNEKRGMRESEREREYMVGDSRGMRGLSQRQIPKINSITLIGNTLAKRVHDA